MYKRQHNHEGPDTQGLWGPGFLKSGVDEGYMEQLKEDFLSTLKMAINNLEPAEMSLALIPTNPLTPIKDKRKPIVIDDDIRAILFNRPDGSIIGSLINFGIHVELVWDKNLELTADVAGYLRRGISEGIVIAKAEPIHMGRTMQLWKISIKNKEGKDISFAKLTTLTIIK